MAWNQPGGGDKDPWGNRGSGGGDDGGPPDLDEAFRKVKRQIFGMFGGGGRSGGGGRPGPGNFDERILWGVLVLIVLGWLASGFYIVQEPERAVVTRFGAFQAVEGPGPHWHLPWPIEQAEIVNVARNRSLTLTEQSMLTSDENIVVIQDLAVQYDVKDPKAYLFNVRQPDETLYQVVESVMREVVGQSKMDPIITEGRGEVADKTHQQSQKIVDGYGTGINIQSVNLQNAQPPEPVQPAFQDAIAAREDKQRFIQKAEAVRNKVIPEARGQAAQTIEEAKGYKARVIDRSRGDVSRFTQLLSEYQKSPEVTRKRLYLDTMERVLGKTGKVLVDRKGEGDNLIYMPLDRMLSEGRSGRGQQRGSADSSPGKLPGGPMSGAANSSQGDNKRGNRPDRSRESSE